jgi:hypothetical protein
MPTAPLPASTPNRLVADQLVQNRFDSRPKPAAPAAPGARRARPASPCSLDAEALRGLNSHNEEEGPTRRRAAQGDDTAPPPPRGNPPGGDDGGGSVHSSSDGHSEHESEPLSGRAAARAADPHKGWKIEFAGGAPNRAIRVADASDKLLPEKLFFNSGLSADQMRELKADLRQHQIRGNDQTGQALNDKYGAHLNHDFVAGSDHNGKLFRSLNAAIAMHDSPRLDVANISGKSSAYALSQNFGGSKSKMLKLAWSLIKNSSPDAEKRAKLQEKYGDALNGFDFSDAKINNKLIEHLVIAAFPKDPRLGDCDGEPTGQKVDIAATPRGDIVSALYESGMTKSDMQNMFDSMVLNQIRPKESRTDKLGYRFAPYLEGHDFADKASNMKLMHALSKEVFKAPPRPMIEAAPEGGGEMSAGAAGGASATPFNGAAHFGAAWEPQPGESDKQTAERQERMRKEADRRDDRQEDGVRADQQRQEKTREDKAREDRVREDRVREDIVREDRAREDRAREDRAR